MDNRMEIDYGMGGLGQVGESNGKNGYSYNRTTIKKKKKNYLPRGVGKYRLLSLPKNF